MSMSSALVNRAPWFARMFGGRQAARSIHFLLMLDFSSFLVIYVMRIVMTGFVRCKSACRRARAIQHIPLSKQYLIG
jgi:thiosulfate reductase cytochrome b subunit